MSIEATNEKAIAALALEHAGKGSSYDGIAMILNEEGYLTTGGKEWTGSTVSALLVKNGHRKRAAKAPSTTAKAAPEPSQADDVLLAVHGVLVMAGMSDELKIETALFLLRRGKETPA